MPAIFRFCIWIGGKIFSQDIENPTEFEEECERVQIIMKINGFVFI